MSKRLTRKDDFAVLATLIDAYKEAAIAESWAGGGDPVDIPILKRETDIAREQMNVHIQKIKDKVKKATKT